jgi:hypothetical protein
LPGWLRLFTDHLSWSIAMATSIACSFFLGFAFCVTSTCAFAEPQSLGHPDGSAHASAGRGPIRYFDLVNVAPSVTSLAVAPAGSGAFRDIEFGAPLGGGLISITVQITGDGCRYDFRVEFDDGRARFHRDVDVCRYRQLRLTDREGRPG